jgi:hypothetical protein
MKTETILPFFPGFYETSLDLYYRINDMTVFDTVPVTYSEVWDLLEIDNTEYEKEICKQYCEYVQFKLDEAGFPCRIECVCKDSPKEYNFRTDRVVANIEMDRSVQIKMIRKIFQNKERFSKILKDRFTSHSGFISFYSNNFDTWKTNTGCFFNLDEIEMETVLMFLLDDFNEDSFISGFEYQICENVYPENYITMPNALEKLCKDMQDLRDAQKAEIKEYIKNVNLSEERILEVQRESEANLKKQINQILDDFKEKILEGN